MTTFHNGKTPPFLRDPLKPSNQEWFWVGWDDWLESTETILTSVWALPAGFTLVNSKVNETKEEEGVNYPRSNAALISTTLSTGEHYISNTITTSENQNETRGFFIRARDFTTV